MRLSLVTLALVAYKPLVFASSGLATNSTAICQTWSATTSGVSYSDVPSPLCLTCSSSTETFHTPVASSTNVTSLPTIGSSVPQTSSASLSLTQQLLLAETVADRFNLLQTDPQFVFDFNQLQTGAGQGGELVAANRKTFPALVGTGLGMAVGRVGPCGMNTFHIHPRSAELQLVIEGRLVTEMAPENGVLNADGTRRVVVNEIGPYQMTPFYQGSVHTQFNPDCTNVTFVASFANEDFGTGQVVDETMDFTDDVIAASFGQTIAGDDIEIVRQAVPTSIALGVAQCLQQCGIQKRSP